MNVDIKFIIDSSLWRSDWAWDSAVSRGARVRHGIVVDCFVKFRKIHERRAKSKKHVNLQCKSARDGNFLLSISVAVVPFQPNKLLQTT